MKTPREIISEQHRDAVPKLDELRKTVISELELRTETSKAGVPVFQRFALTLWRELVLPCRKTWSALAAIWIGILITSAAMNFGSPGSGPVIASAEMTPQIKEQLEQQRKLLATLLDLPIAESEEDRPNLNNKRSQITRRFEFC